MYKLRFNYVVRFLANHIPYILCDVITGPCPNSMGRGGGGGGGGGGGLSLSVAPFTNMV